MESFSEYIKGFASGVKSLLIGMRTSMKVFCQPKVTEQYPENRHTTLHIPERHRAQLVMPHDDENHHHCIACGLCQMACPNGTIKVISEMRAQIPSSQPASFAKPMIKSRFITTFRLCVSPCPSANFTALPIIIPIVTRPIPSSSMIFKVSSI